MKSPEPSPRKPNALGRILGLVLPEWRLMAPAMVFLAISSASTLVFPQAIRLVIDGATGRVADTSWTSRALLLIVAALVIHGVTAALRYILFDLAAERAIARLRVSLYERLLSQEVSFFDQRRTGELSHRLSADSTALLMGLSTHFSVGMQALVSVAGGVALLAYTSPQLTLVMLAVVPPVMLGAHVLGGRVRGVARQVQDELAGASHLAEEAMAGIRTVRAFDAERSLVRRYAAHVQSALKHTFARSVAGGTLLGGTGTAGYGAGVLVVWYGGRLVSEGRVSAGALASFLVYTLFVATNVTTLAERWGELMRAMGAAERVFELLDRAPAATVSSGRTPERAEGRLTLRDVHFSYPTRPDAPVLRGIDLEVAPGERIALVGPSGSGKSTIASLLMRLYDPTAGTLQLDGHPLRELDAHWLRQQIGTVAQEPILFSGTIAENIRLGREDASDEELAAAARAANAHDFILRFPDGYRTLVGERGMQLSGGQKQRIAIARAVLKDPRILLLDEATSALDSESEHLVQEALERLMKGRTSIVIAHRLSTVRGADRVLVVADGRLVQSGSHSVLVKEEGLYRRLVERQFVSA